MQIIVIGILAITLAVHKCSAIVNPSSKQKDNYGTYWLAFVKPLTDQASELHNQLESECKPTEVTTGRLLEATTGLQKQLEDRDSINKDRFEIIEHLLENNTVLQKQYILESISGLQTQLEDRECVDRLRFEIIEHWFEDNTAWQKQILLENISGLQKQLVSNDKELAYIKQVVMDQQNKIDQLIKTSTTALTLQKGFIQIGSKYYFYEKNELTWSEALQKCNELGAHLVSFENLEEMKAVLKKFDADYFWVDINKPYKNSGYFSQTTGFRPSFIKWMRGEPNNSDDENCVEGVVSWWTYGFLNVDCNEEKVFICEI